MADQTNIIPLNPNTFSTEVYSPQDEGLITSLTEDNTYDLTQDYVEFFVYSLNNSIVAPFGNDGTFTNYRVLDNELYIDPEVDTNRLNISTGTVNNIYNFLRKRLSSSPQSTYYISEISSDRTEIRLDSTIIDRAQIIASTNEFISYREQDETFPDFYLNLGSNILLIANNILLDTDNTVLIKLYEPLPQNITVNVSLWVVEKISNGLAFRVEFPSIVQLPTAQEFFIQGPNYNLANKTELNNSTEELTLDNLTSPNSQSEDQLSSLFNDPSVNISVDYTKFGDFVNFSSAKSRIENFQYKVSLIESTSEKIASQSAATSTSYTSSSLAPLNNIIKDTITNFDRFEYYLYFESGSNTYPKTNSIPPYQNALTGSAEAISWYNTQIISASDYDELNQDWIYYSIPEYIRDDSTNDQYLNFTNMVGQFVDDNIWMYIKDTTNKWDADNRINHGVSKDLVAQVLRDMGVKLYQNNFSSTDLYSAFLGFTDSGSLFPFPYMTGSVESSPGILDTPDGYEYITNFISSSDEAIPLDDINKRIYKRIYHNLPYLLKAKGTVAGLRTLITSYGIPDTILRISEFGGKDKINTNDWDLWQHQYNYKFDTNEDALISTPWSVNPTWGSQNDKPQTLQFRFKVPKSGSNAVDNAVTNPQQILWSLDQPQNTAIGLDYFGGGFTSGSYSGSIPSSSNEYANLVFTTDNFATTSSVYLPFFDGEWWSVMITKEGTNFNLYAGNKIYNGSDGSQIGFVASSSFTASPTGWDITSNTYFPSNRRTNINAYEAFSGSYQEIRYFSQPISQSVFKDYVMNPQSSEGNGTNGSANQLLFRASLGGELYTGSESIHPKVSFPVTQSSFNSNNSSFSTLNTSSQLISGSFTTNREWIFYDSPPVGIKNRNTDKIKRQDLVLPEGDTLSNQISIQQSSFTTDDYTNNLNLLEVAFSPQNEINDDIINQIGFFNVGDYIGDPRLVSSSADTYPSLVELSKEYFKKYTSSYDVYDYIRLIKFFDNSLFKMIKDFVPVRTGLASGIVVKQHILERQKYPTPQAAWTRPEYTGSVGSIPSLLSGSRYYKASTDYESFPIVTTSGSDGGTFLPGYVTQSWDGINVTPLGDVPFTQNNEEEFYDGEFSGSIITVTNGELNPECDVFKEASTTEVIYNLSGSFEINTYQFLNKIGGADYKLTNSALNLGKIYANWQLVKKEGAERGLVQGTNYYFKIVGFGIKIPNSLNGVNIEDYIVPTKKIKILDANFISSNFTTTGWTVAGKQVTGQTSGDFTLTPTSVQRRQAYPSVAVGGEYFYVETEPSNLTFQFFVDILDSPGDIDDITVAAKGALNTIFEPFVPQTFQNSDCNPLINNATDITPSTVYYDVDYANNPNVAVNFGVIMSGSAPKAKIQDFNYYARRSIIPRYQGSKNTSNTYNVEDGAIDATQALFAYFNWVGGTSPEWGNNLEDRSVANLRFLLDINGKVIKPIADSQGIIQRTVENNFTEGKIATLAFDDETGSSVNFSNLLGNHTIFKSGKDIVPIVYSQTESTSNVSPGGYTGSLTFVQGDQQEDDAITDYRLRAFTQGNQFLQNDNTVVEFPFTQYLGTSGSFTSDTTYSPKTTAAPANKQPNELGVTLEFKAAFNPDPDTGIGAYNIGALVTFQFEKNGTLVGNSVQVDWAQPNTTVFLSYFDSDMDSSDDIKLVATTVLLAGSIQSSIPVLSNSSFFKVFQTPPPGIGAVGPGLSGTPNYWIKGGVVNQPGSERIQPNALGSVYGQKQQNISGSGFFGITNDFTLQVGDEFRFQGTETQTYRIIEVDETTTPPTFVVDRYVNLTNTEMDWFLVRRYIDNPANIILEVDKPAGGTSPGILKPQYLSKDAEDNIDTILENLRRDTLI